MNVMDVENEHILEDAEMEKRYFILQQKVQELHISEILNKFREAGFDPILIKGWAAGRYYPNPGERQCSDVDLAVAPEKYGEADEFVAKTTFPKSIDLHCGLRQHDTLPFEDLFANSLIVKCGDTQARVLRDEDHLRVLCTHWLIDGGGYKNRLWDIYHLIDRRNKDFDWDRALNAAGAKRRRWIVCAIGLAERYLALDLQSTPIADEAKNLPRWLIQAVEKEWESDLRLQPLHYYLHDRKTLWKQIKKRIPPNPIQSTIELEGDFDKYPRALYQFANIFTRFTPSFKRVSKTVRRR